MMIYEITETMRMGWAHQLADAAGKLDWLKNSGTPEQKTEAAQCLNNIHDIAGNLAGSRVGEVYAPSDEPEIEAV